MILDWINYALIVILLLLSGFFSSSETALFSLDELMIRRIREKKIRDQVRELLKNSSLLLITILVGNTMVNTAVSTLIKGQLNIKSAMLMTLIITCVLLFFGEITPKTLAILKTRSIASFSARLIHSLYWLMKPVTSKIDVFVNGILVALSKLENNEKKFSMDELNKNQLAALISIVNRENLFEEEEQDLIEKVLKFSGKEVWNIMTPRTRVVSISEDMNVSQVIKIFREKKFSKIPVFQRTDDNIVGVIYLRDVFPYIHGDEEFSKKKAKDIMRRMYFVPETKKLSGMLDDFKVKHLRIAGVVDEYGSSLGIVTIADVLGEIVGEFIDESFDIQKKIIPMEEGKYLVSGDIGIDDFNEYFDVDISSEEYETLAGYLIDISEDIPDVNYSTVIRNIRMTIYEKTQKQIVKLIVENLTEMEKKNGGKDKA